PLTGLPINVAPIGTGLMWMPSDSLAHLFTSVASAVGMNVKADGYSQPYITAICLTSYIFGCLVLLLCYSLLKHFFAHWIAALTVVAIWLATPLIFYTVVAPPWSHASSFLALTLLTRSCY